MTVYVIEYRHLVDKERGIWSSKISQDGYGTLEEAQAFIETRSGHPEKCSDFYYQTEAFEEYYIHEIKVAQKEEAI